MFNWPKEGNECSDFFHLVVMFTTAFSTLISNSLPTLHRGQYSPCKWISILGEVGREWQCIPPGFYRGACLMTRSGHHPENNLAKFGYILDMKVRN
jgi:hypothetical protein